MTQKPGRNDPCHCGSGKKYKNCHMQEDIAKSTPKPFSQRKFTAKVISNAPPTPQQVAHEQEHKAAVNYSSLMERSFGNALHPKDDKPPLPTSPTEFLVDDQ